LVAELSAINSADDAAMWAHRNLPAKNSLTAGDAQIVEAQFRARLSTIGDGKTAERQHNAVPDEAVVSAGPLATDNSQKTSTVVKQRPRRAAVRDLGKTVRLRDKEHRRFVSRQACLVCGRTPSDPHHLTFIQPRALGHRVSDEFTVPVCRTHHRELHRQGDEAAWWGKLCINPVPVALKLWQHTRPNGDELTPSEGIAPSEGAQKVDVSIQGRASTNNDTRADAESAVSKGVDPLAKG
jgi:hypothetical protein